MSSPLTGDKENANPNPRFGTVQMANEPQGLKRTGSVLEWGSRKKPTKTDPLVHHGRHFGRTVHAFANIHSLILAGLSVEQPDLESTQQRREYRVFKKLLKMIPNFEERLLEAGPEEIVLMAGLIQKGASSSRSDDTSSMKSAAIDWITPENEPLKPSLFRNQKVDRGFNHEVTGRLLCPTSLDWSDPEIKAGLRNKEITISGADWPRFLYRDEIYDPEDPWKGLLRAELLVLHIFTSPSSTEDAPRATRSGNARIHGMTRVTPASIAYTATQVRFALSSATTFCRTDRDTDSETFYTSLLELLEDLDEEEEIKALLSWWNGRIFPSASNTRRIAPENSALSNIRRKRASKKASASGRAGGK
ncbi:hypothetical protein EST38_g13335 [Candolleomyces aberdarensis]|uniref:Uncharacterized protein n=1 Tax=Candolleomyces aberdarensis TaxID=2316362 RepID=A0A4Q2D0X3_9AGAR|nr:hypothetical protein EST38_g13335 [Candolleomyces aberdarensis]